MTFTVRKMRGKNDVFVRYGMIEMFEAELKGISIVDLLIEKATPVAKERKWRWFFEELEKRKNREHMRQVHQVDS